MNIFQNTRLVYGRGNAEAEREIIRVEESQTIPGAVDITTDLTDAEKRARELELNESLTKSEDLSSKHNALIESYNALDYNELQQLLEVNASMRSLIEEAKALSNQAENSPEGEATPAYMAIQREMQEIIKYWTVGIKEPSPQVILSEAIVKVKNGK